MVSPLIKEMLEARLGHEIRYPADCTSLSIDILNVTGQRLGVITLKRMLGFANDVCEPRFTTLDIIASYLGYENFSRLLAAIGDDTDLSFHPRGISAGFRHAPTGSFYARLLAVPGPHASVKTHRRLQLERC
ncbi:MAG: hypothetical protein NC338_05145 [Firmicutes bacterium]|nr:hypothetical protein [Bacillota bacterium]MCM1401721.1 hypothetical protein [Bacteroides sp.]MCM1477571.1 hypothetical protein [Bacteroides sp.]